MSELELCPWCGSPAYEDDATARVMGNRTGNNFAVACTWCEASAPGANTMCKARTEWNTRHLSTQEAAKGVDHTILEHTFAVQYNPNCPSPWLVRLAGKDRLIDLKPYSIFTSQGDMTDDLLGFGTTFEEAADAALRALAQEEG